jgi:hypothetical protein
MFRLFLFALGAVIAVCVAAYFVSGRQRYLSWAWRLFAGGLAAGVFFFAILIVKRLI